MAKNLVIGVVGVCKSGKTVLKEGLEKLGYSVQHIAQEHSSAPSMWKKIANPDILIYLVVSFENTLKRSTLNWKEKEYQEQLRCLEHAKSKADLIVQTDEMTIEEVINYVVGYLSGI